MQDDLDEFVAELQEQIYEQTKKAYGEEGFERWLNMRHMGRMQDPDGYARLTGKCGDTMEIFLKFEDGRVKEASFLTDGCGSSAVFGSFAAEMAIGKTPDELAFVTGDAILDKLGGLPKEDEHCAFLAGETVQEALNNYMTKQVKETRKGEASEPDS